MSKKKIIYLLLSLFFISSIVGFIVYFNRNEKKVLKYLENKLGEGDEKPSKEINSDVNYNKSRRQWLHVKKDSTIYFSIDDKIRGKDYDDYSRDLYVEDYDEYLFCSCSNDKLLSILKKNRLYQTGDIFYANFIYNYLSGYELDKFLKKINFRQKFCRFPITDYLFNKKSLYSNYSKMKYKYPDEYNFMVETYILPEQIDDFEQVFNDNIEQKKRNLWIVKPQNLHRGKNIKIVDKINDVIEKIEVNEEIVRDIKFDEKNNVKNNKNNKKSKKKNNKNKKVKDLEKNKVEQKKEYVKKITKISKNGNVIVSKYIEPSIINNKKYDLKIMCLITSYDPLMIYLYDDGIVRFSTENYSEDKSKLTNNYIHLTNASVNENNSKYIRNKDFENLKESTSSLSSFKKYCEENKIDYNTIMAKIKDGVIKAILSNYDSAVRELKKYNLPSCKNLFEIFGVQIILDKDYNPYIIGFNSKSGLYTNSEVGKKLYDNVMCDFLNIIGIRKYNRKTMKKNNRICSLEENLRECTKELERYRGHFELIFPLKNNIDKYSKFINNKTQLNTKLWSLLSK